MLRSPRWPRARVLVSQALTLAVALAALSGCERKGAGVTSPAMGSIAPAAADPIPYPGRDEFVTGISNPHLAFAPGKSFRYEGDTPDGHETIVVEVTNKTKRILGVVTIVVHDRCYLNGSLVEETFDWYAQDSNGNVWYFGEDSREMKDGQVIATTGSWEAGVNGASPGIIMLADPRKGDSYQQEFAAGVAEDRARVVGVSETVDSPLGHLTGCLETLEWTPLEPGAREYKFYAPGIGHVLALGKRGERIELVAVQ